MNRADSLAIIGDVHLEPNDAAMEPFLALLAELGQRHKRILFIGDLFTVWVGRRELEQPHHTQVLEACRALRRHGVNVGYVEGNRDFRIAAAYQGDAFDRVTDDAFVDQVGGRSVYVVHGHFANPADRQYRAWHHISRSPPFWSLFNMLPRSFRSRRVVALERSMRGTNQGFKTGFPESVVRRYGEGFLQQGHDLVVLGHFHIEKRIDIRGEGEVVVLPEWKGERRHLEIDESGDAQFVDWPRVSAT